MIGANTNDVVTFTRELLGQVLPPTFHWNSARREMRERQPWGFRSIYVQVLVHGSPSGIMLSPRIRNDQVEAFVNDYREWDASLLSDSEIARYKRNSLTWSMMSAAAAGEQSSISLPAEERWLSNRLARQAEQALSHLERLSTPQALLAELRAHDLQRELALYHLLGRYDEGRALCKHIRAGLTDRVDQAELTRFAELCSSRFETAPT